MRIDAHHHVWDLTEHPQTWMTSEEAAGIGRNFSIQDWAEVAIPAGITHSVLVQTVGDPTETPDLLELAAAHPTILGVVGWVDSDTDVAVDHSIEAQLDRLLAHPGANRLKSIRDLTQSRANVHWLAEEQAERLFRAAGTRGLAVDLLITDDMLPAAGQAIRSAPATRFIIDHLAKPDLDTVTARQWADRMRPIAAHGNVSLKLSGFATLTADFRAVAPRLREYLDVALNLFGAPRTMFGSDWPVCTLGASYPEVVGILDEVMTDLSTTETDRIFSGTAIEWYDLRAGALP